jgi:hypothetical protein
MITSQTGMRDRVAAQSVIEKLLSEQDAGAQPSRLAKFFGASPVHPSNESWHAGAIGERLVADLLQRLPSQWRVFHSIPVGARETDIDHLLVGPAGVFTINTKHHAGKSIWVAGDNLMVDGRHNPHIRAARAEAHSVEKVLRGRLVIDPYVHPIIALIGVKNLTFKEEPSNLKVIDASNLVRWLKSLPAVMDVDTQEQIAFVVDDPETWRIAAPVDRDDLMRRYTELTVLKRQAKLVQAMWGLIGTIAVVAVVYSIATALIHAM